MKEFLKHISIYGLLPVLGKFAGFFLIPIYARVFSSYEFGMVELFITLIHFLLFACNLEFYTAIGRFFFEKKTIDERKTLISTGLILTLFFTSIIVISTFILEDKLLYYYFDKGDYSREFRSSLIWLFFSAIYTYLGVIPRYEKKPKVYVIISVVSLLIRIFSTVLYVLYFKVGIIGVIFGHITGSIASMIFNSFYSRKYLSLRFSLSDARAIFKFAVPIVPGLLLVGLWNPLSRSIISRAFSVQTLGLLAFAVRITSVMEIINSSIRLAWNPLLFENFKKPNFKKSVRNISEMTGILSYTLAITLSLLSPEIARYIGTKEYVESAILISLFSFRGSIEVLRRLRGFGPLLNNRTILFTWNEILGMLIGILLLYFFSPIFGLTGIGVAFLFPSIIKYIWLISYTEKNTGIRFFNHKEFILIVIMVLSIVLIGISIPIFVRALLLGFTFILVFKWISITEKIKLMLIGK